MNNRYKVRIYESGDGDGSIAQGTIVIPIDRCFSLNAKSAEDVERKIEKDVAGGQLRAGRVYQICPQVGNAEPIRSIAICAEAISQRVYLDMATGLYSEFRRIRHPEALPAAVIQQMHEHEAVPA